MKNFMNKSIDAVSEWKLADDNTYKISLAKALNDLIQMKSPIKESDTLEKFLPYLDETIVQLENFYKAEERKVPTPASVWRLVCLGLVKEAVMKTVKDVASDTLCLELEGSIHVAIKMGSFCSFCSFSCLSKFFWNLLVLE